MSETTTASWNPRSAFAEVGGYVWLPRLLDKCRHVTEHPHGDYMSLEASFMDKQFLSGLALTGAQVRGWVGEGLADEAIAVRIAEQNGHDPARAAAWSAGFTRRWKLVFLTFDADEGRMAPGLARSALKGLGSVLFAIASLLERGRTRAGAVG